MSPMRVVSLAIVAVLGLSGAPAPPAAAPPTAVAQAEELPDELTRKLTSLNPHLTPGQVSRIRDAILVSSARYGLDPALVASIIEVESTFRPEVRSNKGALGLMQVMPYMIRPMGLAGNPSTIEANIEAGCMILAGNIRRLGEADGISAYFWGSDIRGTAYLERVQAARERFRGDLRS